MEYKISKWRLNYSNCMVSLTRCSSEATVFWWNIGNQKTTNYASRYGGGVTWPRNYEPALRNMSCHSVWPPSLLATWIVAIIFIAAFLLTFYWELKFVIIERWHLINTIFSQRNRFLYYGRRKITLTWHQVAGRDLDHFDKATAPQKQLFWQISLQKLFNKQGRAFLTWFRLTGDGVSLGLFFVLPGKWRFITRRYPWVAGKPNQISGAWIGVAQLLFF